MIRKKKIEHFSSLLLLLLCSPNQASSQILCNFPITSIPHNLQNETSLKVLTNNHFMQYIFQLESHQMETARIECIYLETK
jgi:hypothetical protein